MKNWIKYFVAACLILMAVPMVATAAEKAGGSLTVEKNDVDVSLSIPEGKTQAITSLRVKLFVALSSGSMKEPSFQFDKGIPSRVKDASVSKEKSGYEVDLILSGKRSQALFDKDGNVKLGTLSVKPDSEAYEINVSFEGIEADEGQPDVSYMSADAKNEARAVLENVKSVTLKKDKVEPPTEPTEKPTEPTEKPTEPTEKPTEPTEKPTEPTEKPTEPTEKPTEPTEKPTEPTEKPTEPATQPTEQPGGSIPNLPAPTPPVTVRTPSLKAKASTGSNTVVFTWTRIDEADGYVIYKYDSSQKKYTAMQTITSPAVTAFNKKFSNATTNRFKISAYKVAADGNRVYSQDSAEVKITVCPAKVKGIAAKQKNDKQVTISWKKVNKAKGYQIYRSKKKNGKYTIVKTIKKGGTKKCNLSHKNGETYYYKVRAFVNGANGKRVYGAFSAVKSPKKK